MKRLSLAIAIVAAMAFAIPSSAMATGATDEVSDLTAAFNPNATPAGAFVNGGLFAQVTTLNDQCTPVPPDTTCTPFGNVPAEGAEVVTLGFDHSIKFTTKKLAKCTADLTGTTTQAAVDACGSAQVGSGAAKARFSGFPFPQNEADFTVTAFNGPTSVAGQESSSGFDTGMVGGNPTIILHARSNNNTPISQTVIVKGEILNYADVPDAPAHAALGAGAKALYVPNAPDVAGDAGAVTLFNSLIQRNYTYVQNGHKVKASYVSATCDDNVWAYSADWVYDDHSTDTDQFWQNCAIK